MNRSSGVLMLISPVFKGSTHYPRLSDLKWLKTPDKRCHLPRSREYIRQRRGVQTEKKPPFLNVC